MNISKSGYYKWLKNKNVLNNYEKIRNEVFDLINEIHNAKPSYGYHRINAIIRKKIGLYVSDNLVHKCCKFLNIKSRARHYKYLKPGLQSIKYPNIVNNDWTTSKPLEKIVSDMTCIYFKKKLYNLTFYLDVFNNEILTYKLSDKNGDVTTYYDGLKSLLNKIKGLPNEVILHTDQGMVYSSRMFSDIHKYYNIKRSMSRAGTPTDNPIIESVNGWIKAEMITDFKYYKEDNLFEFIDNFIFYYNNERPAYALNYKTPIQYKIDLGF